MPRNFSELKSGGGTIPMLSPTLKSGGTRPPPRPPPIDARARSIYNYVINNINGSRLTSVSVL